MSWEWWAAEAAKDPAKQHILLKWATEAFRLGLDEQGRLNQALSTNDSPQVLAFWSVAYDIYCLKCREALDANLLRRLKIADQFEGARYELWVAACFIRAGFTIQHEDEQDRKKRHCEFTATDPVTGESYAVEAKRRHRNINHVEVAKAESYVKLDIQSLVAAALKKRPEHELLIFVDVNMPPVEHILKAPWISQMKASKERLEIQKQNRAVDAQKAFLFLTNHPYHYLSNEPPDPRQHMIFTVVNQPDLYKDPNLVVAQHPAIIKLAESITSHFEIPSNFPE